MRPEGTLAPGDPTRARDRLPARRARGGLVLLMAVVVCSAAACAGMRRPALDPPPGHRAVLGRLDLSRFEVRDGMIEIVRDDGTFTESVRAGWGRAEFAITLPPGRYLVTRLRAFQDGREFPNDVVWDVGLAFDVGAEPAVYIGTVRVNPLTGRRLQVEVVDEYDDTVQRLRARYADIPDVVTRALAVP
jgi:hypothetical protein